MVNGQEAAHNCERMALDGLGGLTGVVHRNGPGVGHHEVRGSSADAVIFSTPRGNWIRHAYRNTDFEVGSIRLTTIFSRSIMSGIFGAISFFQVSDS